MKKILILILPIIYIVSCTVPQKPWSYTFPDDAAVKVIGRQILLNDEPFYIKGVCWNPVPKGAGHPGGLDYAGFVEQDSQLMAAAGINAVRTYEPITDTGVLDTLYSRGIYVINTVYPWGGNEPESVIPLVDAVKDHPAILMWCVGNEWNYNGIYADIYGDEAVERLNQAAEAIRSVDPNHPITTVYGHLPNKNTVDSMPNVDVWGLNVYSGIDFGNIFTSWDDNSKPMFMAEYGADAWNSDINAVDLNSQAQATRALTQLLLDNSSVADAGQVCVGGTIFEWADEWWKAGDALNQDSGGIAPGGGPYPDSTFNEEYWGIVDIDRNPRPAYYELQNLFLP